MSDTYPSSKLAYLLPSYKGVNSQYEARRSDQQGANPDRARMNCKIRNGFVNKESRQVKLKWTNSGKEKGNLGKVRVR